jgi:hypothetical protein
MGLRLSKASFIKTIRRVGGGFELDMKSGASGCVVKIPDIPFEPGILVHPEVSLSFPLGFDSMAPGPKELYLYFATVAGHPLLRDMKHFGACFLIHKRRRNILKRRNVLEVRYIGSLEFSLCWKMHSQDDLLSASPICADVSIVIDAGELPSTKKAIQKLTIQAKSHGTNQSSEDHLMWRALGQKSRQSNY